MASIISKDSFIEKYLIGTQDRDYMIFNPDKYIVGVEDRSFCCGINLGLNFKPILVCPGKNKLLIEVGIDSKNNQKKLCTIEFPLEIYNDESFDFKDEGKQEKRIRIYKR